VPATGWGCGAMARRRLSPLGLRLAAAFVTVAVAAVAVYAVLTVTSARNELTDLMLDVHREDAAAAAAAAARAYGAAGNWEDADLTAAVAVAARGQATLVVRDVGGTVVTAPAEEAAQMLEEMHGVEIVDIPRGDPVVAPVTVDGGIDGRTASGPGKGTVGFTAGFSTGGVTCGLPVVGTGGFTPCVGPGAGVGVGTGVGVGVASGVVRPGGICATGGATSGGGMPVSITFWTFLPQRWITPK